MRGRFRCPAARSSGALVSIPTELHEIEEAGVRFVVRVLTNLARKDAAKNAEI